jgi:ribosomal protein L9
MDTQSIDSFEQHAAEIVAAAKGLLREFEDRIGESINSQRVAASEARAEGVQVARQLQELARSARAVLEEQRQLVTRLERDWQLRIDANAQRAGESHAKAFGAAIARGLEEQLTQLTSGVAAATRRFTWTSTVRWIGGIALAIPLIVTIALRISTPSIEGVSADQLRAAVSQLQGCSVGPQTRVCVLVDDEVPAGKLGTGVRVVHGT